MKIEEIRELVQLLEQSQLNMLEISEGESCIRLEKAAMLPVQQYQPTMYPVFGNGMLAGGAVSAIGTVGPDTQMQGGTSARSEVGADMRSAAGSGAGMGLGAGAGAAAGMDGGADTGSGAGQMGRGSLEGRPIKCPMVGVFYGASTPGEAGFVSVGSRVEKGDVLCIVEAMKLMNEIIAEESGEIVEICVKDGDVVEFGQSLFYIR